MNWQKEFQDNTWLMWAVMILGIVALFFVLLCASVAHAETDPPAVNIEKLANAIYKAENSKAHPYGILKKYVHTSARQACINTIKSNLRRWHAQGAKGEFIAFLGKSYCPVGALNDPRGLNRNWVKNVSSYYYYNYYK